MADKFGDIKLWSEKRSTTTIVISVRVNVLDLIRVTAHKRIGVGIPGMRSNQVGMRNWYKLDAKGGNIACLSTIGGHGNT